MKTPFIARQNIASPLGQFWFLTGMLSNLIRSLDMGIKTEPELVLSAFESASPEQQDAFLKKVSFYLSLVESAVAEGIPLLEDKQIVTYALKKLELAGPPGLYDQIEDGDYLELYDPQGIQIFANFEFCVQISYAIEETFFFKFEDLYERDSVYNQPTQMAFLKCFTEAKTPFSPGVEAHTVTEKFSKGKKSATVKPQLFSPLYGKSGQVEAMLSCLRIENISE